MYCNMVIVLVLFAQVSLGKNVNHICVYFKLKEHRAIWSFTVWLKVDGPKFS